MHQMHHVQKEKLENGDLQGELTKSVRPRPTRLLFRQWFGGLLQQISPSLNLPCYWQFEIRVAGYCLLEDSAEAFSSLRAENSIRSKEHKLRDSLLSCLSCSNPISILQSQQVFASQISSFNGPYTL